MQFFFSSLVFRLAHAATPPNEAVARRVFDEIFNQGKFEAANEIYAKDFVNHGFSKDVDLAAARISAVAVAGFI